MLTGLLAARNITLGERNDLWSVNVDQDYQEEVNELPDRELAELEAVLGEVFHKLDGVSLGGAVGATAGVFLGLVTLFLVLKGGDDVGANLRLLAQYFPGFTVSYPGSLLSVAYGLIGGFAAGWSFALVRNTTLFLSIVVLNRRAQLRLLRRVLDFV